MCPCPKVPRISGPFPGWHLTEKRQAGASTDVWMDGRMFGRTDGWTDRWTDGMTDGRMFYRALSQIRREKMRHDEIRQNAIRSNARYSGMAIWMKDEMRGEIRWEIRWEMRWKTRWEMRWDKSWDETRVDWWDEKRDEAFAIFDIQKSLSFFLRK